MIQKLLQIMGKMKKSKKGFTIVELMVVVIIIGVITAIAIPVYNSSTEKARLNSHKANVRILLGAAVQCIASEGNPGSPVTWSKAASEGNNHKWESYLQEWPGNPHTAGDEYQVLIDTEGKVTVYAGSGSSYRIFKTSGENYNATFATSASEPGK